MLLSLHPYKDTSSTWHMPTHHNQHLTNFSHRTSKGMYLLSWARWLCNLRHMAYCLNKDTDTTYPPTISESTSGDSWLDWKCELHFPTQEQSGHVMCPWFLNHASKCMECKVSQFVSVPLSFFLIYRLKPPFLRDTENGRNSWNRGVENGKWQVSF